MKIIRSTGPLATPVDALPRPDPWKILVVDDEPDVRQLTTINLRGFTFLGRGLLLLEAGSVDQAKALLVEHPDIAVALVDVVMETDDAGLKLVEHIRSERGNAIMRLVIRTGQPGMAPELYVIDNYDIDDYRDKTELTAQKLYTTVRLALKGYRDLQTIELNRAGLSRILAVTPDLYNLHRDKLEEYFQGVLMQLIGICKLGHSGMISTIDGMVMTVEGHDVQIRAGAGELEAGVHTQLRREQIAALCSQVVQGQPVPEGLRDGALVVPLQIQDDVFGFVYLESAEELSQGDHELIHILANQCAAGLDNFRLHHSLEESYEEVIDMLGQVAEFKDSATGAHIVRIQEYTRRLALSLGLTPEKADVFAKASRLHDIGKVGIADAVLRKPGPLDLDERSTMQRHSEIGDTILKRAPSLATARTVARSHHERWDGTGYPDRTAGADISYVARIVAVADVFDALVSARPYKDAWDVAQAIEEIRNGAGTQFDPTVAAAFLDLYDHGDLDDLLAKNQDKAQRSSNTSFLVN
jgi:response regulator RpfG family c-di-GMP phosphodiesterase